MIDSEKLVAAALTVSGVSCTVDADYGATKILEFTAKAKACWDVCTVRQWDSNVTSFEAHTCSPTGIALMGTLVAEIERQTGKVVVPAIEGAIQDDVSISQADAELAAKACKICATLYHFKVDHVEPENPEYSQIVAFNALAEEYGRIADRLLQPADAARRPKIVCLCGSGRFREAFEEAEFSETLAGNIVLTIGCNTKDIARDVDWKHVKPMLDELHLRKIDMADEILVVNVDGYVGESTKREIAYATWANKQIRYMFE